MIKKKMVYKGSLEKVRLIKKKKRLKKHISNPYLSHLNFIDKK